MQPGGFLKSREHIHEVEAARLVTSGRGIFKVCVRGAREQLELRGFGLPGAWEPAIRDGDEALPALRGEDCTTLRSEIGRERQIWMMQVQSTRDGSDTDKQCPGVVQCC